MILISLDLEANDFIELKSAQMLNVCDFFIMMN